MPDYHAVCIREGDPLQSIYLEGEVVVSRSPSSHPGDVMVMTAIGRPPQGSPFALATPTNCVVFSTKGLCEICLHVSR